MGMKMNFGILLLAWLAVFSVPPAIRAINRPMVKNLLRLAAVPVAFLVTLLLHLAGLFTALARVSYQNTVSLFPEWETFVRASADGEALFRGAVVSFAAMFPFVLCFLLVLILLWTILVPFLCKLIEEQGQKQNSEAAEGNAETASEPADGSESNQSRKELLPHWAMLVISIASSAIGGLMISAVLLAPGAQLVRLSGSVTAAYEEQVGTGSEWNQMIRAIDEDVVSSLHRGVAPAIYRYTGMTALMQSVSSVGGNVVLTSGEKTNVWDSLNVLAMHGVHAVILYQDTVVSDEEIAEDLDEIAKDPAAMSVLAGLVLHMVEEVKNDPESSRLPAEWRDFLVHAYGSADAERVVADLRYVINAMEPIAKTPILNELSAVGPKGLNGDTLELLLQNEEFVKQAAEKLLDLSIYDDLTETLGISVIRSMGSSLGISQEDQQDILNAMSLEGWDNKTRVSDLMTIMQVAQIGLDMKEISASSSNNLLGLTSVLTASGKALDALRSTACAKDVPEELFRVILKNEHLAGLVDEATIDGWFTALHEGKTTYASLTESLRVLLELRR